MMHWESQHGFGRQLSAYAALAGLAAGVFLGPARCAAAAVGFRGSGDGVYPAPTRWSQEKTAWKKTWETKMPSWGNSSPVPVGGRVFVCAEPDLLVCVDQGTGAILWQSTNSYSAAMTPEQASELDRQRAVSGAAAKSAKEIRDTADRLEKDILGIPSKDDLSGRLRVMSAAIEKLQKEWEPTPLAVANTLPSTHGGNGYSSPTPVSDGDHVWACFGNGVVACYSVGGERKWIRVVEKPTAGWGHSASPRLQDGRLIVHIASLRALDPKTGQDIWQAKVPSAFGTPVLIDTISGKMAAAASGKVVLLSNGEISKGDLRGLEFNSPVGSGSFLYTVNSGEAAAYEFRKEGDADASWKTLWKSPVPKNRIYSSPAIAGGILFGMVTDGILVALDAATGAQIFEKNIKLPGTCYTSLTIMGDRLLAASEGGELCVLTADKEAAELLRMKIEGLKSTPAVSGNKVFVRTMSSLLCLDASE